MPRPIQTFRGFVGRKEIVDLLKRQIAGALARRQTFPHSEFVGPSGVGKTLLAQAMAAEFGANLIMTTGYISRAELADRLIALKIGDFIFVDEAHAMKAPEQELLLGAIDDLSVPVIKGSTLVKGSAVASVPQEEVAKTVEIKPFTLFLATDQPGALRNALQERMRLKISLGYYTIAELREIVDRMATIEDILISPQAARLIAQVSAGLPRRAKHHLQNLRTHFSNSEQVQVSLQQVREFLRDFKIDDKGLGPHEHQYLAYLKRVGAASLESLAICLGLDCSYVRHQIEPLLLRECLVKIVPGGRKLTPAGRMWIVQQNTTDNAQETEENG